jgi:hypothetical protein
MVAATDALEAGPLGGDRLVQQLVGRELLVGAEVEVAHRHPGLAAARPRRLISGLALEFVLAQEALE